MSVHDTARMGAMAMNGAMEPPRGFIGGAVSVERIGIVDIEQLQFGSADAAEMDLIGIHEELAAIIIDGDAEMIRDGLMHIEARGPLKGSGEIGTGLPMADIGVQWCGERSWHIFYR